MDIARVASNPIAAYGHAVRVLLGCSLGGLGHLTPVLAAARALNRLGHETVILVPPSLADTAAQAGVAFRVGAQPTRTVIDGIWERVRAGPPEAVRGLIDRELFAARCTEAMLPAAGELVEHWRPALVVREPCEYATAVAAHRAGLAQVQLGISQAAIEHGVLEMVSETLERHSPGAAGALDAAPYVTSFPASLDPSPWPDTHRFRPPSAAPGRLPDWWPGDDRPLIYATFGTVLGHLAEARPVLRTALDALAELPARVLVTVGRFLDPAGLGAVPLNTRVERWVAQEDVLAHASVVVCHGGSGTTCGALGAGVPLVICPLFADQSANGQMVQRAGAGIVLDPSERAPGGLARLGPADVAPLRRAVEAVLREPGYRQRAEQIGREMAGTPTLQETLHRLLSSGELPAARHASGVDRRSQAG